MNYPYIIKMRWKIRTEIMRKLNSLCLLYSFSYIQYLAVTEMFKFRLHKYIKEAIIIGGF